VAQDCEQRLEFDLQGMTFSHAADKPRSINGTPAQFLKVAPFLGA